MTVGHQASGQLEKGKLQFFLTEHLTRYKFPCRNLLTALWKSWGGTFTWRRRWSQQPGFEPNPPPNVWAYAEVHTPEAEGSHRALDGLAHSSAIFALVWVFTPQA